MNAKDSTEEDRWALASLGLVVSGVAGALVALFTATDIPSRIGDAFALIAAGGAIPLGFVAFKRSQRARIQAEAEKLESNDKIAAADRRANEATTKLDEERRERLKLERQLAPRSLQDPVAIATAVAPYAGATALIVFPPEHEPEMLGRAIDSALTAAGIVCNVVSVTGPDTAVSGVRLGLYVGATELDRKALAAISTALQSAGLAVAFDQPGMGNTGGGVAMGVICRLEDRHPAIMIAIGRK